MCVCVWRGLRLETLGGAVGAAIYDTPEKHQETFRFVGHQFHYPSVIKTTFKPQEIVPHLFEARCYFHFIFDQCGVNQ